MLPYSSICPPIYGHPRPAHYTPPVPFDFSRFDAVLLDLDGTLYRQDHPLPASVDLIYGFIAQERKFVCISNGIQSPAHVLLRLRSMGMEMSPGHVYTAAEAAVEYVVEHFSPTAPDGKPRVFNLSTDGIQEMLNGKVQWVWSDQQPCDVVVAGNPAAVYVTIDRMQIAMRLIRNGAALIGICADRAYPGAAGLEIGTGAMTTMLAYATSTQPIFFGKPHERFFRHVCDRLNTTPNRCVIIGDNLESDIAGAKALGMFTVLVLTGVTRQSDLANLGPEQTPDLVIETLGQLL
jgi:HAD superfamily hydrolase (TIGR01450 family)